MPSQTKSNKCKMRLKFFKLQLLLHTDIDNKNMCKLAYKNQCLENGF